MCVSFFEYRQQENWHTSYCTRGWQLNLILRFQAQVYLREVVLFHMDLVRRAEHVKDSAVAVDNY